MESEFPYAQGKKILVACSGGLDSIALSHLLFHSGFDIALAHCNFSLREEESDEDEMFVKKTAWNFRVPFYSKRFDTDAFANQEKVSIQMAARELRYQWFESLLEEEGYDFLVTGHHADDNLETFFINLSRGTGVRGLTGIPSKNKNALRPLLPFSRNDILEYAKSTGLYWREDSSNKDTKYLRNNIRQTLIPSFKDLGWKALKGFQNTQKYLGQSERLIDDYMQLIQKLVMVETQEGVAISIPKLEDLPNTDALLYELLSPFGFTDFDGIHDLLEAQTGKQITSPTHTILKNRDELLISERKEKQSEAIVEISEFETEVNTPISLQFSEADRFEITNAHTIFVAADKLSYPLVLRKWQDGDMFHPFGMQGKKKLSKFFKDEKLSLVAKENCWLLCSGNQIVWVVGYRLDERFKVTKETKKIIRIDYIPNT